MKRYLAYMATHLAALEVGYAENSIILIEETELQKHQPWLDKYFEPVPHLNSPMKNTNEQRPKDLEL